MSIRLFLIWLFLLIVTVPFFLTGYSSMPVCTSVVKLKIEVCPTK